jgi:hypothetical protein
MSKQIVELTGEQIEMLKEKGQEITELKDLDFFVGKAWLFRTVTYFTVGTVTQRIGNFLLLSDASWVADTGRFMSTIKNGTLNEVEPVGIQGLNLDAVVDFFPWIHKLPTDQK